jgi:hypothetical protein
MRIERPWSTDPDAPRTAVFLNCHLQQRVNRGCHRGEAFLRAPSWVHRHACVLCDFALRIDESCGHFSAADIDADCVTAL